MAVVSFPSSPLSGSSFKALLKSLSSRASSDAPDLWVAATILFSAATYFFEYGSNIATAWKYYILEYHNQSSDVRIHSEGPRSEFPGIFPGIVAIMAIAHVINALVFYLHLDKSKEAVKCAYLLPVIYLRKLTLLIFRTGQLQGVRDLRSNEIDAVYNILAAALETGPQLVLQFHVFAELGYLSGPGAKPPTILVLSLAASFLSGAYNGGLAMATTSDKATLFGRSSMGIAGGLHIVSALLVRSLAFEVITEEGFYHSSSPFRYYYFYLVLVIVVPSTAFWILLRSPTSSSQSGRIAQEEATGPHCQHQAPETIQANFEQPFWKTALKIISYAYVSITLGPLYPLVSHARQINQPGKQLRIRLAKASAAHFSLDLLVIVFVCGAHGRTWLTPCYLEWSRPRDRRIHKRMFKQRFMSCSWFKALLGFSLLFYVITIASFIVLDVYTANKLEKKSSFAEEEENEDLSARGNKSSASCIGFEGL
ncbi:uncharacterized protein LOC9651110 isoform X1 [Selaginella moellendorffii]|nr:uncharacterized protein LOC9660796 [Selaginella moellendorffii]XP_002989436.2 uncharacterized protein LOC9651110 isoform X1 [Selaginella moellendorffii]|eukprot:XP_002962854.2 uncharacterized protein LOC9660796 [Selaginella moellendorffii]